MKIFDTHFIVTFLICVFSQHVFGFNDQFDLYNSDLSCSFEEPNEYKCWEKENIPEYRQSKRKLVVGDYFSCVSFKNDLHCWGGPHFEDLNSFYVNDSKMLSSTGRSVCNLNTAGSVRCFGSNASNELIKPSLKKVQVIASFGGTHCAIEQQGTIKCWGYEREWITKYYPKNVINPEVMVFSDFRACLIDDEGVKCWSPSPHGQVDIPSGISDPRELYVDDRRLCVLDDLGFRCSGRADKYTDKYGNRFVPTDLTGVKSASVGDDHSCVIDNTGVRCWGRNDYGQTDVPTSLKNPESVSVGDFHSCATDDDGVKCWGRNSSSQIDIPFEYGDVSKSLFDNIKMISTNESRRCAIIDQDVKCWEPKRNYNSRQAYDEWKLIKIPYKFINPNSISVGEHHSCALDDNNVKCWVRNNYGQTETPKDLDNAYIIRATEYHSCALTTVGIRCWGNLNEEDRVEFRKYALGKLGKLLEFASLSTTRVKTNYLRSITNLINNTDDQENLLDLMKSLKPLMSQTNSLIFEKKIKPTFYALYNELERSSVSDMQSKNYKVAANIIKASLSSIELSLSREDRGRLIPLKKSLAIAIVSSDRADYHKVVEEYEKINSLIDSLNVSTKTSFLDDTMDIGIKLIKY